MKILLVEDERKIADFVRKGLIAQGWVVDTAWDGDEGYCLATTHAYDVMVFDIMLPGRDGLSVLRLLRQQGNNTPIIMLTARGELGERIEGLQSGADDYLSKPFFVDELVARIQAVCRRTNGQQLNVRQVGNVRLNLVSRVVEVGGRALEMTAREFNLLEYLMRTPGRVFTRTQILEHVWNYDFDPNTNLVDVYIKRIRGKLAEGEVKDLLETVRGIGYRIRGELR